MKTLFHLIFIWDRWLYYSRVFNIATRPDLDKKTKIQWIDQLTVLFYKKIECAERRGYV